MFNRFALLSVAATASVAWAQFSPTLQYDAGNGSLPTAQCWDFNGSTSPAPQVVSGELLTGPVAVSAQQFYDHELLYDFDRDTIVFEWELQVVSSGYNANSCGTGQRAGWYATVTDVDGRIAMCGIGSACCTIVSASADLPSHNNASASTCRVGASVPLVIPSARCAAASASARSSTAPLRTIDQARWRHA